MTMALSAESVIPESGKCPPSGHLRLDSCIKGLSQVAHCNHLGSLNCYLGPIPQQQHFKSCQVIVMYSKPEHHCEPKGK